MPMTNKGRYELCNYIISATTSSQAFKYLGVGDGSASFNDSHNDLQGTKKLRKICDNGFPKLKSGQNNVIQLQTTFEKGEANFNWNEWGVFNAQDSGSMFNRVVQNNSTKLSNQVWVLAVELTFTAV